MIMDVPEEHLLQHGHCGNYSRLSSGGQRVHLHVGSNEGGGELGICCSTGTAASDGFRDVVNLMHSIILNIASILCMRRANAPSRSSCLRRWGLLSHAYLHRGQCHL